MWFRKNCNLYTEKRNDMKKLLGGLIALYGNFVYISGNMVMGLILIVVGVVTLLLTPFRE